MSENRNMFIMLKREIFLVIVLDVGALAFMLEFFILIIKLSRERNDRR